MKVGICTLGCKVNTYESEYLEQELKKSGYEIASVDETCDVYIVNTCTVTNQADVKSRKMIHRFRKNNQDACIVAMGCFIETNLGNIDPAIDIAIGNKRKGELVNLLDEFFTNKSQIVAKDGSKTKFENMYLENFEGRTRAFVKVQDGCENFCSYCIIPYARGKCCSKPLKNVISEVKTLLAKGYQEIVLTGIHTGNYGVDINTNFAELLRNLVKLEGLKRLRISSVEVTELTDEVLAIIKDNDVIVNHFHIPLQAGSDKILKLMNRKYDLAYYEEKINKLRAIRPLVSITTDIIVGFPNETDLDFEETIKNARKFNFAKIHVFPYSVRTGTKAATMPQVDGNVKKERARKLLRVSNELSKEYQDKFLGKEVEVLIEKNNEDVSFGHTDNYLAVKVAGSHKQNTFVKAKIFAIDGLNCLAKEI